MLTDITSAFNAVEKLKKQKVILLDRASQLDKQVNEHYHMIELLPLNAAELSKVTKNLRSLLQKRRECKEHVIAVSNFLVGPVETITMPSIIEKNAANRENRYTAEALAVYEILFGIKKKIAA